MLNQTSDRIRFIALVALCLPVMVACIDVMAVSVALKNIIFDMKINIIKAQWLLSGYTVGTAAFLMVIGKLADVYGRRKVLLWGILLFGLSSLLAALAKVIFILIVARFLQGVASAIMMTAIIALITHEFKPEQRVIVIAWWATALGSAMALGPFVGGAIMHFFKWQVIFIINIPICIFSYYLVIRNIPESKNALSQPIQWLQALCLTVFFILFVGILSEGNVLGWSSHVIMMYSLAAVIVLVFYSGLVYFSKSNLIDFTLFNCPNFAAAGFCGFLSYFCMYAWLFIMNIYLQDAYHLSPLADGVACSSFSLAFAFGSKVFSLVIGKVTHKQVMAIGFGLALLAFLLMTTINPQVPLWRLLCMFALLGFAIMLVNTPSMTLATKSVSAKNSGIASGLIFTIRWLGGTIGIVVVTVIYHLFIKQSVLNEATSFIALSTKGLTASCFVLAGTALIGLICTVMFIGSE